MSKLQRLEERESSDLKQWPHHMKAFFIVGVSYLTSLARGTPSTESIFEIDKCSTVDWGIFLLYIFFAVAMIYKAVRQVQKEQDIKKQAGRGLAEGEIQFKGRKFYVLMCGSFIGGIVGALGLGGGVIFNPLLISLGVPPTVTTATSMYMIMYSAGSSTAIYLTFGNLNA